MAGRGNMIVTLVAQTKNFQDGLKKAGDSTVGFGKMVGGAMNMALGALGLLAGALVMFLPNFIKMGEEARKSELRLANIAKVTGLFGKETETVTKRISEYAEALSFTTGVDDELIRGNQAVLLTFKELAASAGVVGGAFDRATVAALDLSAAGLGDAESSAVQLGKALQDPVNGLTALRRAGVTFTDAEKAKIKTLMESNRQLEAQDEILKAIEGQVGGTADAIASSTDKMSAKFESVAEELSLALLPAVDTIADAMITWLDSVEGKKAIQDLTDQFVAFGEWVASPDGAQAIEDLGAVLKIVGDTVLNLAGGVKYLIDLWNEWLGLNKDMSLGVGRGFPGAGTGNLSSIGRVTNIPAPIQDPNARPNGTVNVNVTGITPTSAVGRTVLDALTRAKRMGIR